MYLSTTGLGRQRVSARGVAANVVALGLVSLATDVSAEMVTAVLPLYFVLTLQFSPLAYGLMDGLYAGATASLRLVGGYLADRTDRRKAVAMAGYGLSALARLGLPAAGGSGAAIAAVLVADRAGKGLRTAPRDALISLSTPEPLLGRAFGVHRALDGAGAFAGPLVALAVLGLAGGASAEGFDALFVTSFCVAAVGLLILAVAVDDRRGPRPPSGVVSVRDVARLVRVPAVRGLLAAACLLGLATIGDGFVYLMLMRSQSVGGGWFPMLAVGTNLVYLLLAAPLGVLADRRGRLPVVLGGYGALLLVYLLLSGPLAGPVAVVVTIVLYGAFYAATDGVLTALAAAVLPAATRTSALALVQSGQALAYLGSSVAFGLAWSVFGPAVATRLAAAVVAVAMVTAPFVLRGASGRGR
ncbi:MFS transporter [Sphaerisporangium fuscum]|uniref:MFS transporter n=1 Tax=Sphaerisporangium fuscum TaxID=2835868 RepID=UPI001BDC78B0|nr:MFS transporter [Sphaerisporangium fuscum]